jgi:hypothetical protein
MKSRHKDGEPFEVELVTGSPGILAITMGFM